MVWLWSTVFFFLRNTVIDDFNAQLLALREERVGANSLRNNYQHGLALSLAEREAAARAPEYALLMRALEERGGGGHQKSLARSIPAYIEATKSP